MQAGLLRHRVTIQQRETSKDAYGQDVITWSDLATVWARVSPLQGREYLTARQAVAVAEVTTRITARNRSDVTPDMRVVFGAHTYQIRSVIRPEERNIEMQLMCSEEVS